MKLSPEEANTILSSLFQESDAMLLIRLDHQGRILDYYPSLHRLIAPSEDLKNSYFGDCIATESNSDLKSLVEKQEPAVLHLHDNEGFLCSYHFCAYPQTKSLLLAGIRLTSMSSRSVETMTKERNRTHKVLLDRISTEAAVYDRLRVLIRELQEAHDCTETDETLSSRLREITALLDTLSLTNSTPLLTPQERKVLAIVVENRSNREIADRLYVSIPTIKSHIASIYKKLGVKSRKELKSILPQG